MELRDTYKTPGDTFTPRANRKVTPSYVALEQDLDGLQPSSWINNLLAYLIFLAKLNALSQPFPRLSVCLE
jgi:hypothetical protein